MMLSNERGGHSVSQYEFMQLSRLMLLLPLLALSAAAADVSPLSARGYAVLPQPQQVTLASKDFRFGSGWSVARRGVATADPSVTSLSEGLSSRFHIRPGQGSGTITLAVAPASVTIG